MMSAVRRDIDIGVPGVVISHVAGRKCPCGAERGESADKRSRDVFEVILLVTLDRAGRSVLQGPEFQTVVRAQLKAEVPSQRVGWTEGDDDAIVAVKGRYVIVRSRKVNAVRLETGKRFVRLGVGA